MAYSISTKELDPQPVLVVRTRIPRSEIAATIGRSLGSIAEYARKYEIAITGEPFARYPEGGADYVVIEPGMRVVEAVAGGINEDEVIAETLPGGTVAFTIHEGAYDKLFETYAALEQWIKSNGYKPAGAPWEIYITDPGQHPDQEDWRTEVCWPMTR